MVLELLADFDPINLAGLGIAILLGIACMVAGIVLAITAKRPVLRVAGLVTAFAIPAATVAWVLAMQSWAARFGAEEFALRLIEPAAWPGAIVFAAIAVCIGASFAAARG
jgi:hypothetical protein